MLVNGQSNANYLLELEKRIKLLEQQVVELQTNLNNNNE